MDGRFERGGLRRRDLRKYYQEKGNLRLKYAALACAGVAVALMLVIIFWIDSLSDAVFLTLRGCAGLFAILFVVLAAILIYRVNKAYLKDKF